MEIKGGSANPSGSHSREGIFLRVSISGECDLRGWRAWSFPLVVIGMNSIAAYVMSEWLFADFFRQAFQRHLSARFFEIFGAPHAPFVLGSCVVLTIWLILFWMYRRRIFLRI